MYNLSEELLEEIIELLQNIELGMKTNKGRMAFQVFVELVALYHKEKQQKEQKE